MKVSVKNVDICLPDVMIVGAAKSGTTSLYRMLSNHKSIYFPPSQKEPFYFCFQGKEPMGLDEDSKSRHIWRTEDYLSLYKDCPSEALAVDASTAYLYKFDESISQMAELYGEKLKEVKVIILLRNPVQRAYSHYTYLVRNGFETLPFEEAIKVENIEARKERRWGFDYLGYSSYPDQVKAYIEAFPHCKILLTEDMREPVSFMKEVTDFLGIEPMEEVNEVQANPSGIPKSRFLVNVLRKNKVLKSMVNLLPEAQKHRLLDKRDAMMGKLLVKESMDAGVREDLVRYFESDILFLQKLIERDLSSWLK
jgi:hypothetical protein